MQEAGIWSPMTAFHDQHSLPRTSSLTRAEILRIRTVATNRNTVHGCRLIRGIRLVSRLQQMSKVNKWHCVSSITHRKSLVELPVREGWAVTGRFHETSNTNHGFQIP